MANVAGYLAKQQRNLPKELSDQFRELERCYDKKLWHQLTLGVLALVKNGDFITREKAALGSFHSDFIADFEHRINPLALAQIISIITDNIDDKDASMKLLQSTKEKVKASKEAQLLCETDIGKLLLGVRELDKAKEVIVGMEQAMEALEGVTMVHSRYYKLSSEYYRQTGRHALYYREMLRYLGCVELKDIEQSLLEQYGFNLSIAALLGDGIYNFGELLAHPVLDLVRALPDRAWVGDLLVAFNRGDMARFEELAPQWRAHADLAQAEITLRQKVCLLCLMEMTFKRPANDRMLSFEDVARETRLPVLEVELLVMKALSLGLVKGTIDQVEARVHLNWVQPRVLDIGQIDTMRQKLAAWCDDVRATEGLVEGKAQEILT